VKKIKTYHRNYHDFDWEKVNIFNFEKNYRKRNISEMYMIHIKENKQKNSLNLMKDTELLNNSYFNIIE